MISINSQKEEQWGEEPLMIWMNGHSLWFKRIRKFIDFFVGVDFVNVSWCSKPYFMIRPNKTITLLNLVIEPSQWVPIIGSVGTLKFDESQRFHQMRDGDVFCTLYLRNPPKFPKLNVFNGFLRFVFGSKTLFETLKDLL